MAFTIQDYRPDFLKSERPQKYFFEQQLIQIAKQNKSFNPVTIVVSGGTLDGLGDLMWLIKFADHMMALPESFRKVFKIIYVIKIGNPISDKELERLISEKMKNPPRGDIEPSDNEPSKESDLYRKYYNGILEGEKSKKLPQVKKILADLSLSHPLHPNHFNKTVFIGIELEDFNEMKVKNPLIFFISNVFGTFNNLISIHEVSSLEFSADVFGRERNNTFHALENFHFGFDRAHGRGILFGEALYNDEQICHEFNDLKGEEKKFISEKILQLPESKNQIRLSDIKQFRETICFVNSYLDGSYEYNNLSADFLSHVLRRLVQSPLITGKRIVLLSNVQPLSNSNSNSKTNLTLIEKDTFLSDKAFQIINALENPYFTICSGDNTFARAVELGKMPIFLPKETKIDHLKDFASVANVEVGYRAEGMRERFRQQYAGKINTFIDSLIDYKHQTLTLDQETYTAFQQLSYIIKERYNFSKLFPQMITQSIIAHHFKSSDTPNMSLLDCFCTESKICLLQTLGWDAIEYKDLYRDSSMKEFFLYKHAAFIQKVELKELKLIQDKIAEIKKDIILSSTEINSLMIIEQCLDVAIKHQNSKERQ